MTSPLSAWRRLDRYLLRNHPDLWLLHMPVMHAEATLTTAVLTLLVWLLPQEKFLEYFAPLRNILMGIAMMGVFLFALILGFRLRQELPLTARWPHALSRWYCLILFVGPVLLFSEMAQARFQQLTSARGYDSRALSGFLEACAPGRLAPTPLEEDCLEALSRFSGRPRAQLDRRAALEAFELSDLATDPLRPLWSDILLILLCMSYASQAFDLTSSEINLSSSAISIPLPDLEPPSSSIDILRKTTLETLLVFLIYYPFTLMGLHALLLLGLIEPPTHPIAWFIVTGLAALTFFALRYVIISSDPRRGSALTWCWVAVLLGLPTLVFCIPLLLSSPEQRLLHQATLLGGFLLLTPWLQRTHNRVRALPL